MSKKTSIFILIILIAVGAIGYFVPSDLYKGSFIDAGLVDEVNLAFEFKRLDQDEDKIFKQFDKIHNANLEVEKFGVYEFNLFYLDSQTRRVFLEGLDIKPKLNKFGLKSPCSLIADFERTSVTKYRCEFSNDFEFDVETQGLTKDYSVNFDISVLEN